MLKIVLLIGFIGHCMCDVTNQTPSVPSNWGPYPDSHTPAAEYGPPPPNSPNGEYGAPPISPSSVQITQENAAFAGQVVEVNTPTHRPSHIYLTAKPSGQFGQLRKPTVSEDTKIRVRSIFNRATALQHGYNSNSK